MESEDSRIKTFCEWLAAEGCRFPKILWPTTETVSGIRGAIALEDIETNEVMLEIPEKLLMCEPKALADPEIGAILKENALFIDGDMILAIYIMNELKKGPSSFFHPFLQILPEPGTISEWEDSQLPLLQVSIAFWWSGGYLSMYLLDI